MLFHTLFAILDLKISNITSISIVTSKCALNLEKRWRNSLRRRRLLKINQKQKNFDILAIRQQPVMNFHFLKKINTLCASTSLIHDKNLSGMSIKLLLPVDIDSS